MTFSSLENEVSLCHFPSLEKIVPSASDLGLEDGQEVYVADQTAPSVITFKLELTSPMEH